MDLNRSFLITSVNRDDLWDTGFWADRVTDEQMHKLADMMREAYLERSFWTDLEDIADYMKLPRCEKDDARSE